MSEHEHKAELLHFFVRILTDPQNIELAGIKKYEGFRRVYKSPHTFFDRTGTINMPVRIKSLFPVPALRPFPKTYAQVCDGRASELLARSERLHVPIRVMWSGGIDSTTVLVALLRNATPGQRDNIIVFLNEDSIAEYPLFYREHIQDTVRHEPSARFYETLGGAHILVSGEHNDQVFGAESSGGLMERFGNDVVHRPYDPQVFLTFFTEKGISREDALFYIGLFERLKAIAPVDVHTNHDVNWWLSFCMKWQSVYFRSLCSAPFFATRGITEAYLRDHYEPFFNTEDFQLWSMNNLDKKIKDTWETYKWPCKDYIFEFTKDTEYRDHKLKKISFTSMANKVQRSYTVPNPLQFSPSRNLAPYHTPDNDFL